MRGWEDKTKTFRFVFWDVLPCKIIVYRRFRGTCCLHHQGDDDGGSMYLWNVGRQLVYTAVHPRRQIWTSYSPPWEPEKRFLYRVQGCEIVDWIQLAGSCKHGNVPSYSIKDANFLTTWVTSRFSRQTLLRAASSVHFLYCYVVQNGVL
jgi:hypothetical protein